MIDNIARLAQAQGELIEALTASRERCKALEGALRELAGCADSARYALHSCAPFISNERGARDIIDRMVKTLTEATDCTRALLRQGEGQAGETRTPKFAQTSCSQCGRDFGPGDHGYSHCADHAERETQT